MTRNEQFKRYVEAGTTFLGMTQQRAEAIVKDLVNSGELARGQAQKAVEWLLERSQKGSEEFAGVVRREVRAQIDSLGLATKDDIARLEARLDALSTEGRPVAPPPKKAPARKTATRSSPPAAARQPNRGQAAPITKAASTRKRPTPEARTGEG